MRQLSSSSSCGSTLSPLDQNVKRIKFNPAPVSSQIPPATTSNYLDEEALARNVMTPSQNSGNYRDNFTPFENYQPMSYPPQNYTQRTVVPRNYSAEGYYTSPPHPIAQHPHGQGQLTHQPGGEHQHGRHPNSHYHEQPRQHRDQENSWNFPAGGSVPEGRRDGGHSGGRFPADSTRHSIPPTATGWKMQVLNPGRTAVAGPPTPPIPTPSPSKSVQMLPIGPVVDIIEKRYVVMRSMAFVESCR